MKKVFELWHIVFIAVLLVSCKTDSLDKTSMVTPEDEQVLRNLKEELWPRAYAEQDTLLLGRILGDDFQMIDQAGNWYNKEDELNWIKEHATDHDEFRYEIKRLEVFENGTAVICGTGHILKDSVRSIYQSSNVLIKRKGQWKAILSHVSGVENLEEDKMITFGEKYTRAWNSLDPDQMASYYDENGSLTINEGTPSVGRVQLAATAKSFMDAFPDMVLTMDSLVRDGSTYRYHWTFSGTNTGPEGTGNKVRFSGFERWNINDKGLIQESIGTFDAEDYNRQLAGE